MFENQFLVKSNHGFYYYLIALVINEQLMANVCKSLFAKNCKDSFLAFISIFAINR